MAAILALLNLIIPQVGNVIVAIRNKNGTTSILTILDAADAQFADNQKQIADWLADHGTAIPPKV